MDKRDEALTLSNPRLLCAVFFGLLAIVMTVVVDTILYSLGIEKILPTFQAIILDVIIASIFGALFGKKIIYSEKPYARRAFLWGFLMVISAIPLYALLFLALFARHHPQVFHNFDWYSVITTYFFILFYSFIFVGLWLAIAAGLAALYLRGHLVYDLLHSKEDRIKTPRAELNEEIDYPELKEQNREHLIASDKK